MRRSTTLDIKFDLMAEGQGVFMFTNQFWDRSKSKLAIFTMLIVVAGLLTAGAWTNFPSLTSKGTLSSKDWSEWQYTYYDNFNHVDVDIDKANVYVKYDSGSGSTNFIMDKTIVDSTGTIESDGWSGYLDQYETHYEGYDYSPDVDADMGGIYRVWSNLYTRYSAASLRHKTTFAQYWNGSENELVICREDLIDWPATHVTENNDCPF